MKFIFFILILSIVYLEGSEVKIGILAFRSKSITLQEWTPTAQYLNQTIPEYHFTILPLTYPEINDAVKHDALDFIITNSGHYVFLEKNYKISRIATMMKFKNGQWIDRFGGVIFTRKNSLNINTLDDLIDKNIMAVDPESLGGYASQIYELKQHKIDSKDLQINFTGMPHSKVVENVLNSKADVGFVRTDVLEMMAQKREIDLNQLKLINAKKNTSEFPYLLSTSLYPEWPLAQMPNTSKKLSNKVVIALLEQFAQNNKTVDGDIGWTTPLVYDDIHKMFQALRLPPYDQIEQFTYVDIWQYYKTDILIVFFTFLIITFYYIKEQRRKKFVESLLSNMGEGVYGVDQDGNCTWINQKALEILGFSENEILYNNQHAVFHHHRPSGDAYEIIECPIYLTIKDRKHREGEEYFIKKDGSIFPVFLTVAPTSNGGSIVIFRDITEEKLAHDELTQTKQQLEVTISASRIGLWEFDLSNGTVIWDSHCYEMLGYKNNEFEMSYKKWLEMMHPDDLQPIQDELKEQISNGNAFIIEFRLKHMNGSWFWIDGRGQIIAYDQDGTPIKMAGIHIDKNRQKEIEFDLKLKSQMLEKLSMYDGLTQIPNRRYFDQSFNVKYQEAKDDHKSFAIMMLDIDYFKLYNDNYGHIMGDNVLKQVAITLQAVLKRPTDVIARYGGEEFVVIVKDCDKHGATQVANSLVKSVSALNIPHKYSKVSGIITISLGFAWMNNHSKIEKEELLKMADSALYQAKANGRNCVSTNSE
ncbi:MAG: diguanylate cyclase [Sulfuricurvum sp.]|nr:diguanylate cyclase [Sulfuricurvum sp.]